MASGLAMAGAPDPRDRQVPVLLVTSSNVEGRRTRARKRGEPTTWFPRTPELSELLDSCAKHDGVQA